MAHCTDLRQPPLRRLQVFRSRLLSWFGAHARRFPWRSRRASTYVQIVSEVLLQRTRAEVVARMIPAFVARYPDWTSLARARRSELEGVLRPLGLWRRRAASVVRLARHADAVDGKFPRQRAEIETIPAVGQYVASAILLFVHGDASPLLDTNMARVLERHFGPRQLADIRHDPYLQALAASIVDCSRPIDLNWAILDLGATVCTPREPDCRACPLRTGCKYARAVAARLTIGGRRPSSGTGRKR